MTDIEFGGLLKRYRKERNLSQTDLLDKLDKQGYAYTESAISKWENGKRTPSPDVVEALEDVLEAPPGWLLKAAGYRAEAEVRSSLLIGPEETQHYNELSAVLLSLERNLATYRNASLAYLGGSHTIGDIVYGGKTIIWSKFGTTDIIDLEKIDPKIADKQLFAHLRQEFPEFEQIDRWADLTDDSITDDLIERLRVKAYSKDFGGKCPGCPS
jgi:transcriptional regulator with XRE-family HTH domain